MTAVYLLLIQALAFAVAWAFVKFRHSDRSIGFWLKGVRLELYRERPISES